jgi:hypothetical protein
MPRLIDDMRAEGAAWAMPHFVVRAHQAAWGQMVKRLHEVIIQPDLPVILIDNVADYYYASDQEFWDLREDFPNLAPPYPAFWCESKMARKIHSKECGDTDMASMIPHGRIGALIHGLDPGLCNGEGIPENTKWILWCELFIDYGMRDCTVYGPHGSIFLAIDSEGAIIQTPWIQSWGDESTGDIVQHYVTFLHPAFLAMSFLHCRNVTIVENEVDKPLAKKYFARTGVRPARYKTLVIEPLKQILRHAGGGQGHGNLQKALHICRGHFRDYREGRGLFGRYHQLVWTPSIVRGSRGKAAPAREIEVKL